ncbi:MAG: tRNA epoxyqueuosine(34) reductase QueG [Rhizomicrobium sp.]
MPNSTADPRQAIRAAALAEGFDVVRFARAEAPPAAPGNLDAFLEQGRHGDMAWLAANAARRADPRVLWADAKSIVVLGVNYGPGETEEIAAGRGAISVYARGDDYHDVIKAMLKRLAAGIVAAHGGEVKVFVDTAPVMEKPLAQAAGAGWQGKHTNLVSRDFGSWLFLGSIFTTLDLPPEEAEADHCGACRRCLDACPTAAFTGPYEIDARRCISYLTIEHKGHIAREFRAAMGNRIYGCDDCLAVCPWNKFAVTAREARLHARAELKQPRLADLARLDDAAFRALFRGSPIKRIGRDRFVRNVLIAIGNSGDAALTAEAERLLDDASPLVRAMAAWALGRLAPREEAMAIFARRDEADIDVAGEMFAISDAVSCPATAGHPDDRG